MPGQFASYGAARVHDFERTRHYPAMRRYFVFFDDHCRRELGKLHLQRVGHFTPGQRVPDRTFSTPAGVMPDKLRRVHVEGPDVDALWFHRATGYLRIDNADASAGRENERGAEDGETVFHRKWMSAACLLQDACLSLSDLRGLVPASSLFQPSREIPRTFW